MIQPVFDDEVIKLLGPEKASVGLPTNEFFLIGEVLGDFFLIKFLTLSDTSGECFFKLLEGFEAIVFRIAVQSAANGNGGPSGNHKLKNGRRKP